MQRQLDLPGTPPPERDHPDPFANHRQQMGADNALMRLCIVFFHCHLCGEEHDMQHYITLTAASDEEFASTLAKEFEKEDHAVALLRSSAQAWHTSKGDADQRQQALEAREETAYGGILAIAVTSEEEYTCDDCNATFQTVGRLRQHRRRNAVTNAPEGVPQCRDEAETLDCSS